MSYKNIVSSVEQDGWVSFLQDRLPYSFRNITNVKENRKNSYELSEPFLEKNSPFQSGYNLWRRALTFYNAGKLIDAYKLTSVFRNAATRILDGANAEGVMRPAVNPREVWDLAQFEKLSTRFNRNRLDCERAVMTQILLALEFMMKSITMHAKYRSNKRWIFAEGHDLEKIYNEFSPDLRDALEKECRAYRRNYGNEYQDKIRSLEAAQSLVKWPQNSNVEQAVVELWKTASNRRYGDKSQEDCSEFSEANWITAALKGVGDFQQHRYGPDGSGGTKLNNALDEYPTTQICHGLELGRFFCEYLFGVEDQMTEIRRGNYSY